MKATFEVKTAAGATVASSCVKAHTFMTRLVGLLNHTKLEPGEALLIDPCSQVHSFFMRFPIDVIFLDSHNTVIACRELKPWRVTGWHFGARRVLECAAGTCRSLNIRKGDRLEMPS